MFRLISSLLLIVFVSQTVGVGLSINFPNVSAGSVSEAQNKEQKKFFSVNLPATLLKNPSRTKYKSMIMVGDVLLARNVEYLMRTNGGDYPFSGLDFSLLGPLPAVVGNFEATVPKNHVPTPIGMIDFSVSTSALPHMKAAGFSHLSLANNHSFDFEESGLFNTSIELSKYADVFGHPERISKTFEIINVGKHAVALVGVNALLPLDEREIINLLKTASRKSDYQIVYVHWGEEYALRHNDEQRQVAEQFVDAGADLVVGHHPHVVQGVDLIDGVPVFYSLGNYIFDQYFSKDVQEGLVLSISFDSGISLIPVTSKATISQPNLMSPKIHATFLETLSQKSHPDLQTSIKLGLINLNGEIATSTKVAIIQDTNIYVQ